MTIEEREKKYGWISKKYGQALSALAGNEVEIEDKSDLSIEPVVPESCELSSEDIINIHDKMVDDFGGEYGIRDVSLLNSLRNAPYSEFFGEAQYSTVFSKAAKYLFDFTFYQVFIDGNKRVGLSLANAYLAANGLTLTLTESEAYKLVMSIANHGYSDSSELVPLLEESTQEII